VGELKRAVASKPRSEAKQGIYGGKLILLCLGCLPWGDPNGEQYVGNEQLLVGCTRSP